MGNMHKNIDLNTIHIIRLLVCDLNILLIYRIEIMTAIPPPSSILLTGSEESITEESESVFFSSLHQSDGTTKMTGTNRLNDVNVAITSYLTAGSGLEILDIGISSGISTLEWLLSLKEMGHTCAMTAMDRILFARLYQFGRIEMLAEPGAHVLLIHIGQHTLTRPIQPIASWRNRRARIIFQFGDILAWLCGIVRYGRDVQLVSRRLQSRSDVRFVERDLFDLAPDWADRFDVVRVANVLNHSYFSEPTLRIGLRNVGNWVKIGGLLALVRTEQDNQNHATIFRRETIGFQVLHRLGSGSEIESLVERSLCHD